MTQSSPAPKPVRDEFRDVWNDSRAAVARITRRLISGADTPREWYDAMANRLLGDHEDAWRIGRGLVGDTADDELVDKLAARAVMDAQGEYLLKFLDDVESGRYGEPGEYKDAMVQRRAGMYPDAMRGTSNRAMVETADLQEQWQWTLGAVEEHCDDCPVLAGMSPWLGSELAYVPGEGGTVCLGNCQCTLVLESTGQAGIPPLRTL